MPRFDTRAVVREIRACERNIARALTTYPRPEAPPDPPPPRAPTPVGPRRARRSRSSQYRGVYAKADGKFVAKLRVAGLIVLNHTFALELDAALAYDARARDLLGDAAVLNFPSPAEDAR